jgi:hypothetical protein
MSSGLVLAKPLQSTYKVGFASCIISLAPSLVLPLTGASSPEFEAASES